MSMQLLSTKEERGLRKMPKYRFLDTECSLNREEIIYEYNRLIEDIWHLEHTVSELQKDYDLMAEAYEDVSNELYG